ncbi:OmpA family protein [Pelagibacterium sediminicola]|uniref:OmpA family protein n=1 Tax=Pelagibacterium sediminicola TaxID=2248761 RepID=UPI00130099A2|nr:OmpA family protein [Pelagibacterium sediminicola]
MPSSQNLKPVLSAAGLFCALALCVNAPALGQYQVLEVAPGEEPAADAIREPETGSDATIAAPEKDIEENDTEPAETSPGIALPETPIDPPATPEPAADTAALAVPDYTFQAVKGADGTITLKGNAPASVLQAMLALEELSVNIGRFTMNPAAPEGFAETAMAGLHALASFQTGQIVLRDGQWLLSGNASTDAVSTAAIAALEAETPGVSWNTLIRAPSAVAVCRDEVAAYMNGKAILFPSGGTAPTPASLDLLPGLTERLAICPDAPVYVEGHTDADGTAEANLALSIHRAEAVVDALIGLGVDPARLYAVGYGASLPVASNTTADGKRQNRRIVFAFEDIAQPLP